MSAFSATVLIPTYDHGPMAAVAARSALAQTVEVREVLVVGDGAPNATRETVAELSAQDARVHYFDNPKGERHGERHRHAALAQATGTHVLYLSDDDLWMPEHVETLAEAFARTGADLVSAAGVKVAPDGGLQVWVSDLASKRGRAQLLAGVRGIPLSFAGHTMASYRALPDGWQPAPPVLASDIHMWMQFAADPTCRIGNAWRPTVLSLGSRARGQMTAEARLAEQESWANRLADPSELGALRLSLQDAIGHAVAQAEHREAALVAKLDGAQKKLEGAREKLEQRRRKKPLANRLQVVTRRSRPPTDPA